MADLSENNDAVVITVPLVEGGDSGGDIAIVNGDEECVVSVNVEVCASAPVVVISEEVRDKRKAIEADHFFVRDALPDVRDLTVHLFVCLLKANIFMKQLTY